MTKRYFRARLRKSSQNFYSVLYELTVPSIPSLFIASPSVSRRTCRCPFLCIASSIYYVFVRVAWLISCLLCRFSTGVILIHPRCFQKAALDIIRYSGHRRVCSVVSSAIDLLKTLCKHNIRIINFVIRTLSEDRRACEFPFSGVSRVTGQS